MDQELKALVDDIASFDPDDAAHSPADLADVQGACEEAIKAITDPVKGNLDKLDGESLDAADTLSTKLEAVNAAIKARNDKAKAIKARVADNKAFTERATNRPAYSGNATISGAGVKAAEFSGDHIESVADASIKAFESGGPIKNIGHLLHCVRDGAIKARDGRGPNATLSEWNNILDAAAPKVLASVKADTKAQGINEFLDSEGGVLLPPTIASGIWKRSFDNDFNMLSLPGMRSIPVAGNSYEVRARQDASRANGSRNGGVQAYWTAEAVQYTKSQPTYRKINLRLEKLTILIYATDEQLDDYPAMTEEISNVAADEIRFKVNDAMINGTGSGMPMGFLNAACKIEIATAAGANTITAANIDDMWARRCKAQGNGLVWLANQEVEPQLAALNYSTTNTAATWAYVPGTAFNGAGMPTLKGKPVYYVEQCAALGTAGDLILLDPSQIAVAVKSTGVKSSTSMHLRFDYDETAFKFSFRMDSRPYWESALTRYKGSNTLSPIVVIESTRT